MARYAALIHAKPLADIIDLVTVAELWSSVEGTQLKRGLYGATRKAGEPVSRPGMPKAVICYSHNDRKYFDELLTHLKPLKVLELLDYWSDRGISTGERWQETIEKELKNAQVAILLGSPSFFASDFITKIELPIVLDAARREGLQVVYVPVRHTTNHSLAEIKEYQAAQPLDSPLQGLSPVDRDRVYVKLCDQIIAAAPIERSRQWEKNDSLSETSATDSNSVEQGCLESSTINAFVEGRLSREELSTIVGHLIGTPSSRHCGCCLERVASRFLDVADRSDPEIAAAIAVRDGTLRTSADFFSEILGSEIAGLSDNNAVVPVITASFALRFEPEAPRFLSYASLAAEKADSEAEPFTQAIARSWLARVRSIRGEFFEASREIEAAQSAVLRLKGRRKTLARAFSLHQSADRHWRLREFEKARHDYERSIRLYYGLNLPCTAQSVEFGLAISFMAGGQFSEAREVLERIFKGSRDKMLIISALQMLTGEVLPGLAREGKPWLAERALILKTLIGEDKRPETAIRGRNYWSCGRLAWALGAIEIAFAFFREASALFASMAPDAGLYEDALIKLDIIEAMHESSSPDDLSNLALQAATTFSALGADNPKLLALSLSKNFYSRGEAMTQFDQARGILGLAEKRRLLRAARQTATLHGMPPNTLAWY